MVPQFALTFGNSVVATEDTARILYGEQAKRVTVRALCLSIGVLNLLTAAIQGSPLCHGSGGRSRRTIASAHAPPNQATSSAAFAFCWRFLVALRWRCFHLIPLAVLGVFLVYVGIQHAAYVRDLLHKWPQLLIAIAVGLISFARNLMWGALLGFVLEGVLWIYSRARRQHAHS